MKHENKRTYEKWSEVKNGQFYKKVKSETEKRIKNEVWRDP